MPFKDRFKGPFKGRNRAASAEQLEVMRSYNSQETPKFVCDGAKNSETSLEYRPGMAFASAIGWRLGLYLGVCCTEIVKQQRGANVC